MGQPIHKAPLTDSISTGIQYTPILPGFASEFEEREAARFSGYTWPEWSDLPYDEKVKGLAYMRLTKLVKLHTEAAVNQEVTKRQRAAQTRQRQRGR